MEVFEITGYHTGVSDSGVNYLQPSDSFQDIKNGFIYRQILQSRKGAGFFTPRVDDESRIFGIFEHTKPDGTKDLLVFDKNFLNKYNTGTGNLDQIPFGGSMAGYAGFAMSSKEFYISGTSYPTSDNASRFVFCGEGIAANGNPNQSSIFFYNGTDVQDFTLVGDNPKYAPPTMGALTKSVYVTWFNERLNFIRPTIDGTQFAQGILYSGIRNTLGNGDKFNVAGSGLLQADTFEDIEGVKILGQIIALNFDRSNWTLEKTTDAFNPYFIRKVPSVLGTDAKFSSVTWNDVVMSMGKTGVLSTDGRQSLRADNKIPYFTADEIDQINFELIYGGFDRLNNQFLWSYQIVGTDSDTQNSVLVYNYEEETWSVNDQRFSCFGQTDVGRNVVWNQIEASDGNESWARWDTTEELWGKIGLGQEIQKTLAGDDLGFVYQLNQDYDDYFAKISAPIVKANPTVLPVSASGFLPGDQVIVANVEGMVEINNFDTTSETYLVDNAYTVTAATATTVTIGVDSRNFTAYTQNGSVTKLIEFSAKTIPFNPYRAQGSRVYISHIEVLIDTNGGSLKVDVFEDEDKSPFIQNVLLNPAIDSTRSREWITMTVDNEANFMSFRFKQTSPNVGVRITSVRIHANPGGLTSA